MKIAIIGGGSIGLLYSYYLNQFHEVILYVRSQTQLEELSSKGIQMEDCNGHHMTKLDVKPISEWGHGKEELSIICVKQYHLRELFRNTSIQRNHPILFLQNGMGHLKWIDELHLRSVLVGTVEHGAFRKNERTVIHTGRGITKLACYHGVSEEFLATLIEPFHQVFPFQIEKDYKEMLQKKLVVNSIINPLTAILNVQNGVLLENQYYFQMFEALFSEISGILRLENGEAYYHHVVQVCKNTSNNRSSMLRDLEEGRPTEVDAILGYLLDKAKKTNVQAPLLNTLYHFIKGSELEKGGK